MGDGGGRGLAGMAAAVGEEGDEECFGAEGGGREMATSDMMSVSFSVAATTSHCVTDLYIYRGRRTKGSGLCGSNEPR